MTEEMNRDDEFVRRISQPLRAPEAVDATFEARVMSAVHAAARAEMAGARRNGSRSWWLRPYAIRLTPAASLALAAGLAALVIAGGRVLGSARTDSIVRQAQVAATGQSALAKDTVHLVRFVFVDNRARSVSLVGAFNQWRKHATVLRAGAEPGLWSVTVALPAGRYEYAFVVTDANGERWVADPFGETLHDDFGTETSVVSLGIGSS